LKLTKIVFQYFKSEVYTVLVRHFLNIIVLGEQL